MMNETAAAQNGDASQPPSALYAGELTRLEAQSMRGGIITLGAQGFGFALRLGATIVLARLLTPEDYGLFGVAFAIVYLVNLLKDFGLSTATVQRAQISNAQVTQLFYINLATAIGLVLATLGIAPLIGGFYREPRLVGILQVLSLLYILDGLASQPQALLRRALRFAELAHIDIVSTFAGVGVAIVTASFGAGYWSLVLMHLGIAAVDAVGVWRVSGWRPARPKRHVDVRAMLAQGAQLTAMSLLQYAGRNVDTLLVGWYWGARTLGFYDKAYQLLLLPHIQITLALSGVVLSTLSRLQTNYREYSRSYARIISLVVSLGMALTAFLFVAADNAIAVILGPQWNISVPIFRALAPAAFVDTFVYSLNWVLISLGQTGRLFRVTAVITAFTVAGFLIGLPWGAVGVALAFSASRIAVALPLLVYACRQSPLHWPDVIATVGRPAVAAVAAAAGLAMLSSLFALSATTVVDLLRDALFFASFYAAVWVLVPGGRSTLTNMIEWIPTIWRANASQS